jgi:transposase
VTANHRFLLRQLQEHLEYLESKIEEFSRRLEEVSSPFAPAIEALAALPGFENRSAQNVVAEIGATMEPFPSADHLSSWAGVCPGSNETGANAKAVKPPKAASGCAMP